MVGIPIKERSVWRFLHHHLKVPREDQNSTYRPRPEINAISNQASVHTEIAGLEYMLYSISHVSVSIHVIIIFSSL